MNPPSSVVHTVSGDALSAAEVYGIWQIRDAVFAVEQQCDEPDVDGLDLLPGTTHLWCADGHGLASYLRSYVDGDGVRHVGRVCTRRDARGRGLARRLLGRTIDNWGREPIDIGAQAYLEQWYGELGFVRSGANYREAGIEHVPMRRPGS